MISFHHWRSILRRRPVTQVFVNSLNRTGSDVLKCHWISPLAPIRILNSPIYFDSIEKYVKVLDECRNFRTEICILDTLTIQFALIFVVLYLTTPPWKCTKSPLFVTEKCIVIRYLMIKGRLCLSKCKLKRARWHWWCDNSDRNVSQNLVVVEWHGE